VESVPDRLFADRALVRAGEVEVDPGQVGGVLDEQGVEIAEHPVGHGHADLRGAAVDHVGADGLVGAVDPDPAGAVAAVDVAEVQARGRIGALEVDHPAVDETEGEVLQRGVVTAGDLDRGRGRVVGDRALQGVEDRLVRVVAVLAEEADAADEVAVGWCWNRAGTPAAPPTPRISKHC
jgi:hypothetical protein